MNDTTELVKKLLRLCEVLQIKLPMESIVDGSSEAFLSASYS